MQKALCEGSPESPEKAEIEKAKEGETVDDECGIAEQEDSAVFAEQSTDEPDEHWKPGGEQYQEIDDIGGEPPFQ